jgi:hypothetical protein
MACEHRKAVASVAVNGRGRPRPLKSAQLGLSARRLRLAHEVDLGLLELVRLRIEVPAEERLETTVRRKEFAVAQLEFLELCVLFIRQIDRVEVALACEACYDVAWLANNLSVVVGAEQPEAISCATSLGVIDLKTLAQSFGGLD